MRPQVKWVLVLACASLLLPLGSSARGSASRSATARQTIDTRLVFARNQLCKGGDCGKGEIAIMNLDGSGFRRLRAHNGITEEGPVWSPHKDRIAFTQTGIGRGGIRIMNANGHSQRLLRAPRDAVGSPYEPDWSPTGRSILFRMATKHRFALWTVNIRTEKLRQLTSGLHNDLSPRWSPDGTRIGFQRDGAIMTMRLRDHRLRRVGWGYWLAWSPDSRKIAYTSQDALWLMNADGSQRHRVGAPYSATPTWSADGKWIVYTSGIQGAGLFAIHPDGSGQHMIRHESGGPNGWYADSPDG